MILFYCWADHLRCPVDLDRVVYEWEQSMEEVNVFITPPPGVTAAQIQCTITASHVTLGLRGVPELYLNVRASSSCLCVSMNGGLKLRVCLCIIQHDLTSPVVVGESYWMLDQGELTINLQKMRTGLMWPSVFVGHEELDPMAQETTKQQMMRERFQQENPGFDFSNAQFNGAAPDPRTFMGGAKYS